MFDPNYILPLLAKPTRFIATELINR